jgi:hypothetical protein
MPLANTNLLLCVYKDHQPVFAANFDGPIEFGRQASNDETPFQVYRERADAPYRILLLDRDEGRVSRKHLLCEPLGGGKVRLTNRSRSLNVQIVNGPLLDVGGKCELSFPVELVLGPLAIRLDMSHEESLSGRLPEATAIPGALIAQPSGLTPLARLRNADLARELLAGITAALSVFQSAAGSANFYR